MNKKNIHITLNSYLPSLFNGLKSKGVNTDYFLQQSYLKEFDIFNPDGYIPITLLDELLISISNKLGVRSPAFEFKEYMRRRSKI